MILKLLLIAHLLGSAVWIGGHLVLLWVVIPGARREGDMSRITGFERAFGRFAIGALGIQAITGVMLARPWLRGLTNLFHEGALTTVAVLVIAKIAILAAIVALAAHASHRLLPRLAADTLQRFVLHARIVTALSTLLLVLGVGIRTGGLT